MCHFYFDLYRRRRVLQDRCEHFPDRRFDLKL